MKTNKITWVNFLHIYQPPWQDQGVIDQIAAQSYEYLLMLLERYRQFRVTLNVCGNLLEQLQTIRPLIIKELKKVVARGQVELTGTAKFHALLPLIAEREVVRQIKLNQESLKKFFGQTKISGFYFPEMAFSPSAAKVVKSMGYKWLILDPIHLGTSVELDTLYTLNKLGLKIVFRERKISKQYPPEVIFNLLTKSAASKTIISAHDGETYGHFHEDWQGHIEKVIQNPRVEMITVSQYLKSLTKKKSVSLRSATWETTEKDLKAGHPWLLWDDPKNKIHRHLWQLVKLSSDLIKKYPQDKSWQWARQHLDQGLSSCSFWWSTGKKPSPFSSLTWSPEMIDNGVEELIRVARSLSRATKAEKIKAEKIYLEVKKNTWIKHWNKYHAIR